MADNHNLLPPMKTAKPSIEEETARLKDYADKIEFKDAGVNYWTGSEDWQVVQDIRALLDAYRAKPKWEHECDDDC